MTTLQAAFDYVVALQELGYTHAEIDRAYRAAAAPLATDAVLIAALKADVARKQNAAAS